MTAADSAALGTLVSNRLHHVLSANAAFSAASALVMLGFSGSLADWLEISRSLLVGAGIGIVVFAGFVAWVAARHPLPALLVGAISVADLVWVVAAAALIAIPDTLPAGGKLALGLVSLVVLDLGVLEWMGFRRLRRRP